MHRQQRMSDGIVNGDHRRGPESEPDFDLIKLFAISDDTISWMQPV